jgi:hypothetical protein
MEVHAPMTALESRCEEESAKIPGWHSELEKVARPKDTRKQEESKKDRAVEEAMILGV